MYNNFSSKNALFYVVGALLKCLPFIVYIELKKKWLRTDIYAINLPMLSESHFG